MEAKVPVTLLSYRKYSEESKLNKREQETNNERLYQASDKSHYNIVCSRSFSIIWNKLKYEVGQDTWYSKFRSIIKRQNSIQALDTLRSSAIDGKRLVFDNLNGVVNSGEIVAIMGPSGAGKTSLLNILSGRSNNYEGKKYLVNSSGDKVDLTMAFVPQKDYLNDFLTVEENLTLSSMFKNASSNHDNRKNIVKVAKILNLIDCFYTRCGSLSGGEYKRTCIGQELISDPDLLVLDEPTSGLDSYTAKKLISSLKLLIEECDKPMSIIVTIHQPDDEVFHLFDRVYIMGLQGQVVYDGIPKSALKVIESLSIDTSATYDLHRKTFSRVHTNSIASFMLELASNMHGKHATNILSQYQIQQYETKLNQLGLNNTNGNHLIMSTEHIQNSKISQKKISVENEQQHIAKHVQLNELVIANKISSDFCYTVKILCKLELKTLLRNNQLLMAILIFYTSTLLFVSLTFPRTTNSRTSCPIVMREIPIASILDNEWGLKQLIHDRTEEIALVFENLKSQIILCCFYGLAAAVFSVFSLHLRIHTAIKEVTNGWYKHSALVAAIFINTIVRDSVLPMVGVIAAYKLCDNLTSYLEWRMIMISLLTGIFSVTYSIMGLISGAFFLDSLPSAVISVALTFLPQLLCVHIIVPLSMNPLIQHISWISLHRSAAGLLTLIRFGFGLCKCDGNLQLYMNQMKQASFTGLPRIAEHTFDYILSNGTSSSTPNNFGSSNDHFFSNIANLLTKFINFGETIDNCNQFTTYVLKYARLGESEAVFMMTVVIVWFIFASVSMITIMEYVFKKRSNI